MARPIGLRASMPGLWRFLRHFGHDWKTHRALLAGAFGALLLQAAFRLLEPWPLKLVIDWVVEGDAGLGDWSKGLSAAWLLALIALALVLLTGLRALSGYAASVGFALVGNRLLTAVRQRLFVHLQRLSLRFHDQAREGDLVMRVIADIGMVREVAVTAVLPMLGNLLILFGVVAVMAWLHWQLTLLALSVLPLLLLTTLRRSRQIQQVAKKNRQREGQMAAAAAESMGAIRTVQALSLGDTFGQRFGQANQRSLSEGVQAKRLAARLERNVDLLVALSTALVLWYGAQLVLAGELTAGSLLLFVFYLRRAFRPMRDFAKYTARLAKASAAAERVLELLERAPEVSDRPGAIDAPPLAGEIRFEQVEFAYQPGHPVLRQVELHIPAGQRVVLVGPSGCGKSTLTALLMRLYDPQQGRVSIDGMAVDCYRLDSLRPQIAVLLQETLLFAGSVRDNITLGLDGVDERRLVEAAKLANAHPFIQSLPQGYDTPVGERGVTLSGGQRQRIGIARAAVRQAPILILDEPASGLDIDSERLVIEALERLSAGRTTLIVTHRPQLALRCERVLSILNGRVVEQSAGEAFGAEAIHAAGG